METLLWYLWKMMEMILSQLRKDFVRQSLTRGQKYVVHAHTHVIMHDRATLKAHIQCIYVLVICILVHAFRVRGLKAWLGVWFMMNWTSRLVILNLFLMNMVIQRGRCYLSKKKKKKKWYLLSLSLSLSPSLPSLSFELLVYMLFLLLVSQCIVYCVYKMIKVILSFFIVCRLFLELCFDEHTYIIILFFCRWNLMSLCQMWSPFLLFLLFLLSPASLVVVFLIWKQVLSPRQLVKELPSNNHSDTGGHYCVSLVLLCCRPMRIFYGTRTHRQISQITHELAKTAYSKTPLVCLSFSFCVCTCCVPAEIVITISCNTVISTSLPSLSLSSPLHSFLLFLS